MISSVTTVVSTVSDLDLRQSPTDEARILWLSRTTQRSSFDPTLSRTTLATPTDIIHRALWLDCGSLHLPRLARRHLRVVHRGLRGGHRLRSPSSPARKGGRSPTDKFDRTFFCLNPKIPQKPPPLNSTIPPDASRSQSPGESHNTLQALLGPLSLSHTGARSIEIWERNRARSLVRTRDKAKTGKHALASLEKENPLLQRKRVSLSRERERERERVSFRLSLERRFGGLGGWRVFLSRALTHRWDLLETLSDHFQNPSGDIRLFEFEIGL